MIRVAGVVLDGVAFELELKDTAVTVAIGISTVLLFLLKGREK